MEDKTDVDFKKSGSYDRGKLRYPSDVTDEEWAYIAPLIPPAKRGGRKRSVDVREVVNVLMYILSNAAKLSNNVGHLSSNILTFGTMTGRWIASFASHNLMIIVHRSSVSMRMQKRPFLKNIVYG